MTHIHAESILLPLQKLQQTHDEVAHRDILSFDLYKRLKHMVLHFYKYTGKVEAARIENDLESLRKTLIDVFIICMATANALNVSLGAVIKCSSNAKNLDSLAEDLGERLSSEDLFSEALKALILIGGKMAKSIESSDHMERGDPRTDIEALVPELTKSCLAILGKLGTGLEFEIRARLKGVEAKSIFLRT